MFSFETYVKKYRLCMLTFFSCCSLTFTFLAIFLYPKVSAIFISPYFPVSTYVTTIKGKFNYSNWTDCNWGGPDNIFGYLWFSKGFGRIPKYLNRLDLKGSICVRSSGKYLLENWTLRVIGKTLSPKMKISFHSHLDLSERAKIDGVFYLEADHTEKKFYLKVFERILEKNK